MLWLAIREITHCRRRKKHMKGAKVTLPESDKLRSDI